VLTVLLRACIYDRSEAARYEAPAGTPVPLSLCIFMMPIIGTLWNSTIPDVLHGSSPTPRDARPRFACDATRTFSMVPFGYQATRAYTRPTIGGRLLMTICLHSRVLSAASVHGVDNSRCLMRSRASHRSRRCGVTEEVSDRELVS